MLDVINESTLGRLTGRELFDNIYRNVGIGLEITKKIEEIVLNNGGWFAQDEPVEIWAGGSRSTIHKSLRFPKVQPFKDLDGPEIAIDAVEYCLSIKVDEQWWKTVYNINTRKLEKQT